MVSWCHLPIKPEYHQMQLVLWRENRNEPIITYCLTRVMFGIRYALHSTVRAWQQTAIEAEHKYPQASIVARRDFHVDNCISGGDTVIELWSKRSLNYARQLQEMLQGAGFPIKKWISNSFSVMGLISDGD